MIRECAFQFVYELPPEGYYLGHSVAAARIELGSKLALEIPESIRDKIDYVCPVPNTGTYYAMGLARAIKKPYIQGIVKTSKTERSFKMKSSDERRKFLWNKLHVIPELVKGKSLAVVDEAIFTGATLKIVCEMLREAGVLNIFLCIPTAQCRYHCDYGMQPPRQMLLEYLPPRMLKVYFDVEEIFFQSDNIFLQTSKIFSRHICTECFLGGQTHAYGFGSGKKRNKES
ncbi:MAG TPA: hypothetical protein DCR27_13415 [Lachnospiraceae bacterium]|nr:hypothetical protein [Lachnospiraceae bacterium]